MHRIKIWFAPFLWPSEPYTFRRYFWGTLYILTSVATCPVRRTLGMLRLSSCCLVSWVSAVSPGHLITSSCHRSSWAPPASPAVSFRMQPHGFLNTVACTSILYIYSYSISKVSTIFTWRRAGPRAAAWRSSRGRPGSPSPPARCAECRTSGAPPVHTTDIFGHKNIIPMTHVHCG